MRSKGKILLVVLLLFSASLTAAAIYTLVHVRNEALRQANHELEHRLHTFWELARAKGGEFHVRDGVLLIGDYRVNDNFELPDKIKEIFGGTATIFLGDTRVSTNVLKDDGTRAVGTRLVGPAHEAVIRQGQSYRGEAAILGNPYLTAYDPIRDRHGNVIGVLYVGVQKSEFLHDFQHLLLGFIVPLVGLALVAVVSYLMLLREGQLARKKIEDIISFLPDPTWAVDTSGRVVAWNRACEELTGVSAGEMIGEGDHAYAVPFYGERRPMLIDGALRGTSLGERNYCVLEQERDVATAEAYAPFLRQGRGAYVWGTARRLFDEKGRVSGAIETIRDITERKQAEMREHARADILEHIAKDASLSEVLNAIVLDVEQERADIFCSILLVNKDGTRLVHGAAPSLPDFYNVAVNGLRIREGAGSCGTAAYFKRRIIVPDIEMHPYWRGFEPARQAGLRSCWSEPILSPFGELYGTFALYSRRVWEPGPEEIRLIVTAASYASIAIERMNTIKALRDSELKYRELVENANSIIMRMDTEGRITFFNEYAQQFFGYSEGEILGRPLVGTITPVYESGGRNLAEMIREICAKPEKYALTEHENVCRSGETVSISWANKAIRGVNGELEEILCIGQDITERKKMQEMMVQTEKMMTVGGLAAGMAHELNNPIGTIVQHAQNILRRVAASRTANRAAAAELGIPIELIVEYLEKRGVLGMLEAINTSCERAASIISNMLTFSRKSTENLELSDLADLLEKAIELAVCDYDLKKQYDFKNIGIVREFDSQMPRVPVVALEIEQVLLNLLKNAAHALTMYHRDAKPLIYLRLYCEGEWAVIQVKDNGPGIEKQDIGRIFEPFFTTKEVGTGTGLGLSISYSIIVNKHQGSIVVDAAPGEGACFTIRLPLTVPVAPPKKTT